MTITLDASRLSEAVKAHRARREPVIVPHVVGGEQIARGVRFRRENPSIPAEVVSSSFEASDDLVQRAIDTSRAAQVEWRSIPAAERARRVARGAQYVADHALDWAVRLAEETGKALSAIEAELEEVRAFVDTYVRYAAEPDMYEESLDDAGDGMRSETIMRPYGVFGVITPFNYPMALAAGHSIGAVLGGNGVVIKTSHRGPWSGQAIYEMFAALDLPVGLVNVIHGADQPGIALVNSDVDGIGFTGSANVGQKIIETIALSGRPRPVIAEMGGKNPVIVTGSAPLEDAAAAIVYSGYDLAGQKCSSGSRILVERSVHDRLVELVSEKVANLRVGDPVEDRDVFAGPLVSDEAIDRYRTLIRSAQGAGFSTTFGQSPVSDGYFAAPVVISDVPEEHPLARDEHFLPVITVSKVDSFEEALTAANDVPYGLTAGIFTGSRAEAEAFLDGIEAGSVNVNGRGHATTGFYPGRHTFGGWKRSGSTGIQAYGRWYLRQFAQEQTRKIPVNLSGLA